MSFSINPKDDASIATPPGVRANANPQAEKRERAIAALLGSKSPNAQETPVSNPNNVSPEEISAIQSNREEKKPELNADSGQSDNIEGDKAKAEAPKEVTETKEEPLSQQYAVLARKEKALRAKVQAQDATFKAQEAALKQREDALSSKESEYKSGYISKEQLKNDPFGILADLGITYDQITEMAMNQTQTDPRVKAHLDKLERELQAAKDRETQRDTRQAEDQKKAYDQAVKQIRIEAEQLVKDDPEFETIKETGSIDDVVELIEQTFKTDGVLLSVEDAAKEVEAYLIDEALKISRIKKIQQRLNPAKTPEAPKSPEAKSAEQQPHMKTLTNAVASAKKLSTRERAILAMKGELK